MADKWIYNPATEELEPAETESLADALSRTTFEASSSNRITHMRPRRRETAHRGKLPSIRTATGFAALCEMCVWAGVYLAIWRGSGGACILLDVFDGNSKLRYEATTQREFEDAIFACSTELLRRYPTITL